MTLLLAKDLREAVLQKAFQGNLSNTEYNDSSVDEFLLLSNKERLTYEKKYKEKKHTSLLELDTYDIPFDIPSSWRWAYIGDIFRHNAGKALNSSNTKGEKMKYLTTSNVYENHFDLKNLKEMYYTKEEVDKCSVKKNDLLVLEGGDCGRTAIWPYEQSYCIQNHVHRLRPFVPLCIKYFWYLFNFYKRNGYLKGKGIAIQGLSAKALHYVIIPVPPVEEQTRIVAKVDELMAKIDEYEKLEKQLEELQKEFPGNMKDAILQAAMQGKLTEQLKSEVVACRKLLSTKNYSKIEELYDLPDNWINAHLEDLTNSIATKQYQILESDVCKEGKFPVISQSKEYSIGFTNHEERVFIPSSKIVLFGDHTTVVKTIDYPFVVGADGVKLFECTDFILPEYLYYVLTFNASLISKVGGYSRHYKYLKNKSIPLPPIEEQKRIVEKLDQLLPLCDELERI